MKEDAVGLFCRGKLFTSIQKAAEVYELLKEEVLDGLSIGYRTLVDEYDNTTSVRTLKEIDLFEVSVVTFPMNEDALISAVKESRPSIRDFEGILRDAGFSHREAKAIVADGYRKFIQAESRDGSDDELARQLATATEHIRRLTHGRA